MRWILLAGLGAALALTALVVRLATLPRGATLEFMLRDSVSGSWVWDATATLQNRVIHSYYQSDHGPVPRRFTRLAAGDHELVVTAPSYVPRRVPVRITGRKTVLEEPVYLAGYEIPELADFLVFETVADDAYIAELRPVRTDGRAAVNHPCLGLWIGCAVSVQTVGGVPVTEPVDEGSERGRLLYTGEIEWQWDPSPDSLFRYHARIPFSVLTSDQAPYLVFDYLIVVPDPRRIGSEEVDETMERIWAATEVADALEVLGEYRGVLDFYLDTSWNVERVR